MNGFDMRKVLISFFVSNPSVLMAVDFLWQRGSQAPNIILLVVFTGIHAYFLYAQNSFLVGTINLTAVTLLISIQLGWLLFPPRNTSSMNLAEAKHG